MNKTLYVLLIILLTISCGKKEEVKFEAFSPEAFAYDIGDGWEVNSTVNVRGFKAIETDDKLSASLSYTVDLINPEGKGTSEIYKDSKEVTDAELNDIQLEAQFELDSSYAHGMYKIIFKVTDNNSGKTSTTQVEFELED